VVDEIVVESTRNWCVESEDVDRMCALISWLRPLFELTEVLTP
jgi:hypothetical protein